MELRKIFFYTNPSRGSQCLISQKDGYYLHSGRSSERDVEIFEVCQSLMLFSCCENFFSTAGKYFFTVGKFIFHSRKIFFHGRKFYFPQ